ncbi:MAG: RNA polymerase sigma factor [Desulforhopalus sp.]
MKDASDETLVQLVLKGETHLFAKIIERYERPVYNLMYRYCRSEEEAADLSQDVFLRVYDRLSSFNRSRRFFPWLYTLAVNRANDWHRSHSNNRKKLDKFRWEPPETETNSDQEGRMVDREEVDNLYKALDQLPEATREMIMLRYRQELPVFELADIFKVSQSAVKMRIARGLEKMKAILGGDRYESMED